MAFPYRKFYQKMTIDSVTKDWDLADICESDVAGRGDFTTITNYKVGGAPISYPSIPTNAYSLKRLNLSFYENNNQIIIPKSGTFPSIYDPYNIPSYVIYDTFDGPERGNPNVYNFEKTSNSWVVSGAKSKTYYASSFHGGILPDVVAILLQAAGGGGGAAAVLYAGGTYTTLMGGAGGGSGASATIIMANSKFSISLGAPGAASNDAADSMVYDTDFPSNYFRCGGGKAGGRASLQGQTVGAGGEFSHNGWTNSEGVAHSGTAGGSANNNGGSIDNWNYGVYDLSSEKYGFRVSVYGGVKGGGGDAKAGGGGGSSLFSVGGDGGDSNSTSSPQPPGFGAGGGGGGARNSASLNDGSRGGIAHAIVYFGYY